jgi:hypothetical protein
VNHDRVVEAVVRTLGPYVGRNMAASAVRMHLTKLGLVGAPLTEANVERLLEELAPALCVFVGRAKADVVLQGVRDALRGDRSAP